MAQRYDVDLVNIRLVRTEANYGSSGEPERLDAVATFSISYVNRGKERMHFDLLVDASGREPDVDVLCWEELQTFSSQLADAARPKVQR